MASIQEASRTNEYSPIPTSAQQAAVNVLFYSSLLNIFDRGAAHYARWKTVQEGNSEPFEEIREKAQLSLEDIYFAGDDPEKLRNLRRDWSEDYPVLQRFLSLPSTIGEISTARNTLQEKAHTFNHIDRLKIAFTITKTLASNASREQKDHILALAGYSKEERIEILKKIAFSSALTFAINAPSIPVEASVVLNALTHPFLNRDNAYLALAISYMAHYAAMSVNAVQNFRLLKDSSINNSPNAFATCLYFLLNKLLPESKLAKEIGSFVGSIGPVAIHEPFLLPSVVLFPVEASSAIAARNIYLTVKNLLESGADEIWLRKKGKKNER